MSEWYIAIDGATQGPMTTAQAMALASQRPDAHGWRNGFGDWLPVGQIPELAPPQASAPPAAAPAPAPAASGGASDWSGATASPAGVPSDEIDYEVHGHEQQYVEIELDPGESAVAEAGAMMYKHPAITMNTVFGDGTGQEGGFMGKLLGAGKRVLTGESLFTTVFTHEGQGKARVAFAAPYPGHILPLQLSAVGGTLICQKDAFLAAAKGVQIGLHFQRRILTGLFGGEGFIMQKLEGDGWVFIHVGGTLHERELAPGEELHVDTGCLAALSPTVDYDVTRAGNIKSMIFGGEGIFFARLRGPGKVWIQSLPFSRLAGRMLANAPQVGGSKGEGSVLGPLGGLLQGDNR